MSITRFQGWMWRSAAPALAVGVLLALSGPAAAQDMNDGAPVFAPDIALILQENCQVCHQPERSDRCRS